MKIGNISYCAFVIIGTDTIYIFYKGTVLYTWNISSKFGVSTTSASAVLYKNSSSVFADILQFNLLYFVSLNNPKVYRTAITLHFIFNKVNSHFDLKTASICNHVIYTPSSTINFMQIANGLLMMQSNSTGQTFIYNLNSSTMGTASSVPLSQTFNFFYIYGAYYMLQSS